MTNTQFFSDVIQSYIKNDGSLKSDQSQKYFVKVIKNLISKLFPDSFFLNPRGNTFKQNLG